MGIVKTPRALALHAMLGLSDDGSLCTKAIDKQPGGQTLL